MFNEIKDFIIGYSAISRDVLRLAADEYIGMAIITNLHEVTEVSSLATPN